MSQEHDAAYLRLAFMECADEMGRLCEGRKGILDKFWKPTADEAKMAAILRHFYICVIEEPGGHEIIRMLAERDATILKLEEEVLELRRQIQAGVVPARMMEVRS